MSERAAIDRVARLLRKRRLLFVEVGARVGSDRIIATARHRQSAAGEWTDSNPEYRELLRQIVRKVRKAS